jgi:DNA-binding Lrp family transcriptional regulator
MGAKSQKLMSDTEILELVATCDNWADRPVTTATEIQEMVDASVTRQAVHRRLQKLSDEGRIERHKPGQATIWWVE